MNKDFHTPGSKKEMPSGTSDRAKEPTEGKCNNKEQETKTKTEAKTKTKIEKEEQSLPKNPNRKQYPTPEKGHKIERLKKSLEARLQGYLEHRKKALRQNDVLFSEPLRTEQQKQVVLVRGGIDVWFLVIVILLLSFGAVMSYSASSVFAANRYNDSAYFFKRYILFATVSIIASVPFVLFMTPKRWKQCGVIIYGVAVILLLLVLVIGRAGGGAQRWLQVGPITVQPSEIAKMAVVMMLALYMSKHEKEITSRHQFGGSFIHGVLVPGGLIAVICVLVALEKHISGLMIIGMIGIAVMFMGGTHGKWIGLIIGVIALSGCGLVLVSEYAQARVNTWINIDTVDPRGEAWQTLQGLYAIGSGGMFGHGLGNSRQKYGYVSQPQNDFIFPIICEELGFFGALLVVGLFVFLVWRGFKIAAHAPNKYCSLVVYGLVFKTALQAALNIAVVTNSMPNTGVALPFFSSGGSALAIQIFEMAIILSISRYSTQKR